MKYKTLLLGTAAVFAVAGSARAADLAVAESVEYVKVCDAYGAGYFYIPGSDTCLKISGDIEFDGFYNSIKQESAGNIVRTPPDVVSGSSTAEDDVNWWFRTRAEVELTAKSMTDWGMLTAFMNLRAQRGLGGTTDMYMETGWAKIGGFKAGWDASTFDAGFLGAIDVASNFDHDQHQNQVQWSTTAGGWGFFIAAEDPNDNPSGITNSSTDDFTSAGGSSSAGEWTGKWPDIVAAVTGGGGPFHWKGSVGVTDTTVGTGWGGQLWGQWLQGGNSVTIQAAASNGAGALYGANIQPNGYGSGTYWHVSGQVGFAVTSAFTVFFEGGYQKTPGPSAWEAEAEADWTVGKGAVLAADVYYLSKDLPANIGVSSTRVDLMFKRSFAQ
jgi:hypothetical protein